MKLVIHPTRVLKLSNVIFYFGTLFKGNGSDVRGKSITDNIYTLK